MTCKEQILALVCVFHIWIYVWYNHVQYVEGILTKKIPQTNLQFVLLLLLFGGGLL